MNSPCPCVVRDYSLSKDTNRSDDWRSLCELASKEKDPQKLLDLTSKISKALEEWNQPNRKEQVSFKVDTVLLPTAAARTDSEVSSFPGQPSLTIEYEC